MVEQTIPEYDFFISYAKADHDWVEGYLLDALSQSGVTYLIESTFELGKPRLTEFEDAIKRSKRTLLILSPSYLIDGSNEFIGLLVQSYGQETGTWPVIPLILKSVNLPTRLGKPQGIKGLVDVVNNPMYATGVGLVIYGAKKEPERKFRIRDRNIFNSLIQRMKKWFKDVI